MPKFHAETYFESWLDPFVTVSMHKTCPVDTILGHLETPCLTPGRNPAEMSKIRLETHFES